MKNNLKDEWEAVQNIWEWMWQGPGSEEFMAEGHVLQVVVGAPHVHCRVPGHVLVMLRVWGGLIGNMILLLWMIDTEHET